MLTALGTRVTIGLTIAAALGLADVVGIFAPPPDIGQAPPFAATLFATVAGAVTLVAAIVVAVLTARGGPRLPGRIALWLVVAARVASVLVTVPTSFLVGATTPLVVWAVVFVAVTVAAVVLIIVGAAEDAPAVGASATGR